MTRQEKLNVLLNKLREKKIYEIKDKLEIFLQEDDDQNTRKLQDAISEKLDGNPFHYVYFSDFLEDYRRNNPNDPAGYSDLDNRINGG